MNNEEKLTVIVRGREGDVYKGESVRVTSINPKGKFDILPGHANFISLLEKEIQIIKTDGQLIEIPIESALLRNKDNQVEIYLGIDTLTDGHSY